MSESRSTLLIRKNLALNELLKLATYDELTALVEIVLSEETERFFHDDAARRKIRKYRMQGMLNKATDSIAVEVCALGSNTLASAFRRGASVSYDQVVRDVAKELKVKVAKGASAAEVEHQLLEALISRALEGKSEEEKEVLQRNGESGLDSALLNLARGAGRESSLAAQLLDRLDLGHLSILLGGKSGLVTSGAALAVLVGLRAVPVVGVVTAGMSAMAALNRTLPSLAVIVPAVVQIAFIRRRLVNADYDKFFMELRACL
ncbi:hypothetical protein [Pseudomonas silesiensis]|uniref:hypothetical protein n=1 Tax=Pseudomonas silesiensis TaxID=1853130 RepID=UPI0034D6BD4E